MDRLREIVKGFRGNATWPVGKFDTDELEDGLTLIHRGMQRMS